ncbi:hypothetical protein HYV82_06680 [Candidatus Woesearchaeota archaeon]|nr:hypothetical protein [Candidatus Woesearchaeota archaeon]
MPAETVTISKAEYERLKESSKIDWELVKRIERSLEDAKHGRITEIKPEATHKA